MRKILSLLSVVFIGLTANAQESFDNINYIEKWGQLKLVGNQLSSASGEAIQLKGWSTFSLHFGDVNGCLGKAQWELMKHYGANIVRLAMYIDDTNDGGSYLANKEVTKQKVKGYIDDAYAAGMYVLVDWHTLETNGKEGNPWNQREEAKNFFSEISSYAKSKGYNHVLYELCNEPKCDGWATIKKYAEYVIPAITDNQPDAMIIVGTNNWCQDILEPVSNPISKYKDNVLYSFHYYSCSHFPLLGNFRSAQGSIPVFVSQWSAFKFDGSGPFCKQNVDDFIYACGKENTKQLVSWCIWNWSKKNDNTSFFTGTCGEQNLSLVKADDGQTLYGEYVANLIEGGREIICRCCLPYWGPYLELNKIPNTRKEAWRWNLYNYGGDGIGYYDKNGGAWIKDEEGNVIDYNYSGDEVDVFSLAVEMQWLDNLFPWATRKNGKIVAWSDSINSVWKDENGNPTYKSLNGGRNYFGPQVVDREFYCRAIDEDESVDLYPANCMGTELEHSDYRSLALVEDDEWIKYTVDVEKPGYYKISGVIGAEYKSGSKNGEISMVSSHGNHLRSPLSISDDKIITTFGFPKTTLCADTSVMNSDIRNCWAEADAVSGEYDEVLVAFPVAGDNEIKFVFSGDASGVGPLLFEFYQPLDENDPITSVSEVQSDANDFTIYPNPTSGEFSITLADNVEATVDVVNMEGQIVTSQKVDGSATIDKVLTAGVYTVVVKSNGGVSTQRLIVK